ncbi:MAG: tripartite tricarboxylate transporter substrate binding protein [Alphaproteobacteria bacterium]|nr:tripartite tricarboxylate transporter substrate binding protein [Alphaproteobacteria bacterium]
MLYARLARRVAFGLVALVVGAAPSAAQDYPAKPIRIIVPYPAGGGNDLLARVIGEHLTRVWGQPVVIENRAGAAGNIGTALLAQSAPDGYSLAVTAMGPPATNSFLYKNLNFDPVKDIVPVAMIAQAPNAVVVKADSPFRSVKDLITAARASPSKLNYGTPGIATSLHLASALFANREGLKFEHIAYRGNPQVLEAVLKGEIQWAFDSIQQVVAQTRAGTYRALAVSSATRWPQLPDVPTMIEAGVPDFVVMAWFVVLAPSQTPRAVVEKLNGEINRGLVSAEGKTRFADLAMEPMPMSTADADRFIRGERERWSQLIRAEKITAE